MATASQIAAWDYPGTEPPILFFHCTGVCARIWDPDGFPSFEIPNRIIAPDARGHGDSGKPDLLLRNTLGAVLLKISSRMADDLTPARMEFMQ
jgi:pimeloyl-ACP methyl ester carboxylesterase